MLYSNSEIYVFSVILGDLRYFRKDKGEQKRKVSRYFIYSDNDSNADNNLDVAILVLAAPAKLTKYVNYILLQQELPPVNSMCTLSGWGQTIGNVAQPSKKLRYIDYPTASHRDCLLDQNVVLKPWQLCVGRPYGDYVGACHGDSGSPMVYPTATVILTHDSLPSLMEGSRIALLLYTSGFLPVFQPCMIGLWNKSVAVYQVVKFYISVFISWFL